MTWSAARRRLWPMLAALLLVVGGLGGWWLGAGSSAGYPRGTEGFATGATGGVYDTYGQLLRDYLRHSMPGLNLRLDTSEGSVDNLNRVSSGQDAFAFATADAVADFSGQTRLRAIARLYDDYLQLVVPAKSRVQSVADLRGLHVGVGQSLSGVNLVTRRVLAVAGLDPDTDIVPEPLPVLDATKELADGTVDAFFWSGGLPTSPLTDLAKSFPIRIVPLGDLTDKLHQAYPDSSAYRTAVLPEDVYPGTKAVLTMAVPNLLVTREDADPRLVEGLTKAVIDSRDGIGSTVHPAQLVDLRTAVYTAPLPLHTGAANYYRSVKP
ncbi:TAXI family TRAP transporter solute-binding subunit [Kitasatospora sp. NPDC006697]|uniref:TAXI family TRAP transporter solute-binding subunit n=1 Tax=Kitasatospora sp. NPDC006697 TaxID=3364020 RepID=UPI0036807B24